MFTASEVVTGLWVGAKSDVENEKGNYLVKSNITHVLSVDTEPPHIPVPSITKLFVKLDDNEYADLLVHLERCFAFIEEAMQSQGAVIVHCLVGMSRSISVVTAFLMYKEQISLQQALDKIKAKRPYVRPNEGFMEQLSLFEAMGCNPNPHHPLMKVHKLGQFAHGLQGRRHHATEIPEDLVASDPAEKNRRKEEQPGSSSYVCRKCRRALFQGSGVIGHDPGKGHLSFKWHKQGQMTDHSSGNPSDACTSYFIQPVTWMGDLLIGNLEGKLSCPKCSSRLGCFNWAGQQCSCGAWITPAFQIHKNRVDEKRVVALPR